MAIYDKTPSVYDLILEANPDLPFELNPELLHIRSVEAIPGQPDGNNTVITIEGTPGSPLGGKTVSLEYRRLDLRMLYPRSVHVRSYLPEVPRNRENFQRMIQESTGLVFLFQSNDPSAADRFKFYDLPTGSDNYGNNDRVNITVTASSNSLIYTGSFVFSWFSTPQPMGSLIKTKTLELDLSPGDTDKHLVYGPTLLSDISFAPIGAIFSDARDWFQISQLGIDNINLLINYLNTVTGQTWSYVTTTTTDEPYTLSAGTYVQRNVPGDNLAPYYGTNFILKGESSKYPAGTSNRLTVYGVNNNSGWPARSTWFRGALYLHY